MKKILAIALIFLLCFTLFACGDENNTDPTTTTTNDSTTTTTNDTTTTTENNTTTTTTNPNSYPKSFVEEGYTVVVDKDGKEATITDCSLYGDIVIPSTLGGYPVTAIGDGAFSDKKGITSITFPESVRRFGHDVFIRSTDIERVYFKDFKTFCEMDFGEKSHPLSYSMKIYFDGIEFDFTGEVVIPEGVERIGDSVFYNCPATAITIPSSVKSIGSAAFAVCGNVRIVNVADFNSFCEMEVGEFGFGHLLEYVDLYANRTKIDFSGDFVFPDGIERIGAILSGLEKITSITIPNTVTNIDASAFEGCSNLESITIPASVKHIEVGAFDGCENLKRVNITDLDAWNELWFEVISQSENIDNNFSADPLCYGADLYLNGVKVTHDDAIIKEHHYFVGSPMFKTKLPQLTGNTDTIKELNYGILWDTLNGLSDCYSEYAMSSYEGYEFVFFNKGTTFDYSYVVKNDVLVLYVYSTVPEGSNLPGQTGDGLYCNSYYYDIANDKILTTSQAVDKLGVAIPDYADLNNYPLDGGGWIIFLENNELTLEFFI